jgi:beta-N-acetylhexosaminidase
MDAIARGVGTVRAAVMALRAGADVLTISHDLDVARATRDAIVAALETGELDRARLEAAASRSRALQEKRGGALPTGIDLAATVTAISRRAITLVRGDPVLPSYEAVNVVSFDSDASLHLALRRRRLQAESLRVAANPDDEMIENLAALIEAQAARSLVVLMRRAHLFSQQSRAIEALLGRVPEAVLVSAAEPFDAVHFLGARNVLCAYGDDEPTLEALADVLTGRLVPAGTSPVRLECTVP